MAKKPPPSVSSPALTVPGKQPQPFNYFKTNGLQTASILIQTTSLKKPMATGAPPMQF